jgi:hypothetical protein
MTRQNLRAGRDATSIGRDHIFNVSISGGLVAAAFVIGRASLHSPPPVPVVQMPVLVPNAAPPVASPLHSIPSVSSNPVTQLGGGVAAAQLAAPAAVPSQSQPEFSGSPAAVPRPTAPAVNQQVVTQSSPVVVPRLSAPVANQQVGNQSSGSGATNITNVIGNEAKHIVTGNSAPVTINENHGPQSMLLQPKAAEEQLTKFKSAGDQLEKQVLSAAKKASAHIEDATTKAMADASDQLTTGQPAVAQPVDVANADPAPVLDRDTKSHRHLAGVAAELAGNVTANPSMFSAPSKAAFVMDDVTSSEATEPSLEEPAPAPPDESMVKSLDSQILDDQSVPRGDEPLGDLIETAPPEDPPSGVIEAEPPTSTNDNEPVGEPIETESPIVVDEMPSPSIDADTGNLTESEAVSQPENQSAGITEGWVPAVDERSSSEVPPRYKRVINPVHGVV